MLTSWTELETNLELLRRAIPGGPVGWHPERLIFRDWWHWRDHELGFAHGRLALTGQNESGKSTLMALFLPPLLDGETHPVRLDPAMSRDRYLYWYLLGDDDADPEVPGAFYYKARVGYLALEFRHGTSGRFITIGMGVSAARNHPRLVKGWWGFVVPDRRLGRDFDLRGEGGTCLEHRDLAQRLAPPAVVCTERYEYRRQVNQHLFQMSDDDYQALIGMLLQARRPKLAEQSGPEDVCDALRQSLPAMAEARLERVAEVVQNLEKHQRNLEEVTELADQVAELDRLLHDLAAALVQQAATQYQSVAGRLGSVVGQKNSAEAAARRTGDERLQLETESSRRGARLVEIRLQLDALRENDAARLPLLLDEAQGRATAAAAELQRLQGWLDDRSRFVAAAGVSLDNLAHRFRAQARQLAGAADKLAAQATAAGWPELAAALRDCVGALDSLTVTAAATDVDAVRPDLDWADRGRHLAGQYEALAQRRTELDTATEELTRRQQSLANLRQAQAVRLQEEQAAEDQSERRREELLGALVDWHRRSSALDLPDHLLARVNETIRSLVRVPDDGVAGLTEPVRRAAAARQQQLNAAAEQVLAGALDIQVEQERWQQELATLTEHGLAPARGPLRTAARRTAGSLRPLFHWVRFRAEVAAETADRVEAAALESGLLDLLLAAAAGDRTGADAWADPSPLHGVPTLLAVLEPEPDAPAVVSQVLASVGWGAGSGRQWIAADGAWQSGVAAGQVAPWLADAAGPGGAAGLVGAERRAAALQARMESHRRRLAELQATAAQVRRQADDLRRQAEQVGGEADALGQLPWQALFAALGEWARASQETERAQAAVVEFRPQVEAARSRCQECETRYQAALAPLPVAAGLTAPVLHQRSAELRRLVEALPEHVGQYDLLLQTLRDHVHQAGEREQARGQVQQLQGDRTAKATAVAEAQAAAAAFRERLQAPEAAALQQQIRAIVTEQDALRAAEQAAPEQLRTLLADEATAKANAQRFQADEDLLRPEAAQKLQRLRERLLLHPGLAPLAEALDREGPVAAGQRLPRTIDPAQLEEEIDRRKDAARSFLHRHLDLLGDYRPTWAGDTVGLQVDREAVTAAELHRRLALQREEYAQLITRDEQALYQQILYHGILAELRKLIREARLFTQRVAEKLDRARRSTGTLLSLRLRARPADQVPGAAIGGLLEQMDQGVEYLTDERREVLIGQIQAEVERVRQAAAAKGQPLGYYEAIKSALDYRNWYDYQLVLKKPGSPPEVLRNRGFGRHSSSAKAWALVVPLVAGVAARYDAARLAGAPRLVALDDIFAGFDANNQAVYLRFLDDLALQWLITCPDELPYSAALSAVMAYRISLDSGVHVTFPILWDGSLARDLLDEVQTGARLEAAATREREGAEGP